MIEFLPQDAGFMAYFHMTGEKPVDLSIVRSRLLPGTTQVRLWRSMSPLLTPSLWGVAISRSLYPSLRLAEADAYP